MQYITLLDNSARTMARDKAREDFNNKTNINSLTSPPPPRSTSMHLFHRRNDPFPPDGPKRS